MTEPRTILSPARHKVHIVNSYQGRDESPLRQLSNDSSTAPDPEASSSAAVDTHSLHEEHSTPVRSSLSRPHEAKSESRLRHAQHRAHDDTYSLPSDRSSFPSSSSPANSGASSSMTSRSEVIARQRHRVSGPPSSDVVQHLDFDTVERRPPSSSSSSSSASQKAVLRRSQSSGEGTMENAARAALASIEALLSGGSSPPTTTESRSSQLSSQTAFHGIPHQAQNAAATTGPLRLSHSHSGDDLYTRSDRFERATRSSARHPSGGESDNHLPSEATDSGSLALPYSDPTQRNDEAVRRQKSALVDMARQHLEGGLDAIHAKLKQRESEIVALQARFDNSMDTCKTVQERLRLTQKELHHEEALRKSSEEREQALREELSALRTELSTVSVRLAETQLEVNRHQEERKLMHAQLQEESSRAERLTRLLKHSKEERLAVTSRMEMLERRLSEARNPLPAPQLGESRALAMLRELRAEEQVLNERLVARTYQVKEFRAQLADARETLQSAQKQSESRAQQLEEERRRATLAESQLLRAQAQGDVLTRENEELRTECVRLRKAVRVAETQAQVATESIRTVEKQAELFETQVVATEALLATHKEDAEVAQIRVKLLRDELRMVREENALLTAQVRRARVSNGVSASTRSGTPNSTKSKSKELAVMKQQLEEAQEACRAHQAHARFLNTDMLRLEKEKDQHVAIKNTTIRRLHAQIDDLERSLRRLKLRTAQGSQAGADSPQPERMSEPTSREDVEDLRSQQEILQRELFDALVLVLQWENAANNKASDLDAASLYAQVCKQNVERDRWQEWLKTHAK